MLLSSHYGPKEILSKPVSLDIFVPTRQNMTGLEYFSYPAGLECFSDPAGLECFSGGLELLLCEIGAELAKLQTL